MAKAHATYKWRRPNIFRAASLTLTIEGHDLSEPEAISLAMETLRAAASALNIDIVKPQGLTIDLQRRENP